MGWPPRPPPVALRAPGCLVRWLGPLTPSRRARKPIVQQKRWGAGPGPQGPWADPTPTTRKTQAGRSLEPLARGTSLRGWGTAPAPAPVFAPNESPWPGSQEDIWEPGVRAGSACSGPPRPAHLTPAAPGSVDLEVPVLAGRRTPSAGRREAPVLAHARRPLAQPWRSVGRPSNPSRMSQRRGLGPR